MGFADYLTVENPGILAVAAGLLIYIIAFSAINRWLRNRGASMMAAIAIAGIGAWKLYTANFENGMIFIVIVLTLAGIVLIGRIFWTFFRKVKYNLS